MNVRDLARKIDERAEAKGPARSVKAGHVVSVVGNVATITIENDPTKIDGAKFYQHLTLAPGDLIDVDLSGPTPRILGAY